MVFGYQIKMLTVKSALCLTQEIYKPDGRRSATKRVRKPIYTYFKWLLYGCCSYRCGYYGELSKRRWDGYYS